MIIEIIDGLLTNHEAIEDGFKAISGNYKFVLAYNQSNELLCFTYDEEEYVKLMEQYLIDKDLKNTLIRYEKMKINTRSEEFKKIAAKKLVILDDKVTLFDDVKKLAKVVKIKGYKGKLPAAKTNVYTTKIK